MTCTMPVLTDQCTHTLQNATTAACAEATDSSSPQDLWAHVLGVVHLAIQAHARQINEQRSLMSRLADELLVEIFGHLPLWDRIRVETVCHRWRAVSLHAVTALWTDIPPVRAVDTYRALLSRAKDRPITLECALDEVSGIRAFCGLLARNLHRIRRLSLGLHDRRHSGALYSAADDLSSTLSGDAPMLESLCISDPAGIFVNDHFALHALKNPALRWLELDSLDLSRLGVFADSSSLRTLKISTPQEYKTLSAEDWCLLSSVWALESLALHLLGVEHVDVPAHWAPLPRSLQHLHVEVDGDCIEHFVELDDLSRFRTLHLSVLGHPPDFHRLGTLLPFLASETVSASLHVHFETCSLMATDARGRRRVLANLKFDAKWDTLLPNAKGLLLDIFPRNCLAAESAAALPALEALVLDSTRATPSSSAFPTAFSSAPAWPPIDCPRLRVVRLLSERTGGALPANDVLGYLRRLPRLATLVLDGIALEPEPGVELDAALLPIAEQVSETPFGTPWPESYRVWSNSWGKFSGLPAISTPQLVPKRPNAAAQDLFREMCLRHYSLPASNGNQ